MEKSTEVFYWGSDSSGQFGIGDRSLGHNYPTPKCCSFSIPIKKISCGEEHSGFIALNGFVYMMGSNKQGRLGISNPSLTYASRPLIIESLSDYQITDLSCGSSHTAAVTSSGLVFTWGYGGFGALGHSESEISWKPKKVTLNNSIATISCGARHVAAVSEEGSLVVWGAGEAGQLGLGTRTVQRYPVVSSVTNVMQVSCGVSHTLVLLKNSDVLASGGNMYGQLGLGNKEINTNFTKVLGLVGKNAVRVAAGQHSAAVTASGELFLWGSGVFGEFLVPTRAVCAGRLVDVELGIGFGIAIDRNGALWAWGVNSTGCLGTGDQVPKTQPSLILDLQSKVVTQVACGNGFTIALGRDLDLIPGQISKAKSKSTDLEEMKKKINRLQRGVGGLEELACKLEQSKAKEKHVQSLLYEEIRQKEHFQEIVKELGREKEVFKKELSDAEKENKELKDFLNGFKEDVERKDLEIEKMKRILEEVESGRFVVNCVKEGGRVGERTEAESEKKKVELGNTKGGRAIGEEDLSKIQVLGGRISELIRELNDKNVENQKLQEKIQDLSEEIKLLKGQVTGKTTEGMKNAKVLSELQAEKAKNFDLAAQVQRLEEKLKKLEQSHFTKLESSSKEITLLNERINNYNLKIEYYKDLNTDQEKLIQKLKQDLKTSQEKLEVSRETIQKLERDLRTQSSINKEFLIELTKQVASRAESYKSLNIPVKHRKTVKRYSQEEYIDLVYAKP